MARNFSVNVSQPMAFGLLPLAVVLHQVPLDAFGGRSNNSIGSSLRLVVAFLRGRWRDLLWRVASMAAEGEAKSLLRCMPSYLAAAGSPTSPVLGAGAVE